jgi:hypothetical protein
MPDPEPLTARATSKGKQELLLISEHVSCCPPEFVESARARNLSRAKQLHFRGYETPKLTTTPAGLGQTEATHLLVDDRINWLLRLIYEGVHSRKQARLSIGPTGAMNRPDGPVDR